MKLLKTISSTYEFNGGGRGARIRQPGRQDNKWQPNRAPPTPEWRRGQRPEGGARAVWSATSVRRVGSPGGEGSGVGGVERSTLAVLLQLWTGSWRRWRVGQPGAQP